MAWFQSLLLPHNQTILCPLPLFASWRVHYPSLSRFQSSLLLFHGRTYKISKKPKKPREKKLKGKKMTGGRGEAIASGSAGPYVPSQSNSGSNEPNGSRGHRQTMPVSELLNGLQEKIREIELWIRSMVHNGTVFEVPPAERALVGLDVRIEEGIVSGEFKLNWNEILSTEQRAEANYPFGSGADGWRRQPSGTERTEITISERIGMVR